MSENMDRRMRDAEQLLGDILVDTPRIPESVPSDRATPRKRPATPRSDRAGIKERAGTRVVETAKRQGILKPSRGYDSYRTRLETGSPREITQEMDRTGDTTGVLFLGYFL